MAKLVNPPVVEVSEHLKMADHQLPMITLCPTKQFNDSVLLGYGYQSYEFFIKGIVLDHKAGNKTFQDIVDEAFVYSIEKDVDLTLEGTNGTWRKQFYPKYGYCWNLENFNYSNEIRIKTSKLIKKTGPMAVFLTDRDLRTYFDLHLASQKGDLMEVEMNKTSNFYAEFSKLSFFNPRNESACRNYELLEYAECVDNDKLVAKLNGTYQCSPPWLTSRNSCQDMNWRLRPDVKSKPAKETRGLFGSTSVWNNVKSVIWNAIKIRLILTPYIEMENTDAKRSCLIPCTVLVSKIRPGSSKDNPDGTEIRLLLDDYVAFSYNTINYHFTDFLVDIGSSVGLWFGLSVFGLADFGIQMFSYLKACCGFAKK